MLYGRRQGAGLPEHPLHLPWVLERYLRDCINVINHFVIFRHLVDRDIRPQRSDIKKLNLLRSFVHVFFGGAYSRCFYFRRLWTDRWCTVVCLNMQYSDPRLMDLIQAADPSRIDLLEFDPLSNPNVDDGIAMDRMSPSNSILSRTPYFVTVSEWELFCHSRLLWHAWSHILLFQGVILRIKCHSENELHSSSTRSHRIGANSSFSPSSLRFVLSLQSRSPLEIKAWFTL